jgi:hypothetical protein
VPALLANVTEKAAVDLAFLRAESAKAADGTQLFAEYASKRRPVGVRRAPSLSAAAGGEKAPGPRDAASAAMGTMQSLLHHGDASHVQASIACVVSHLDASGAWRSAAWCAWLAEALASWTAQPYRFVVLTFFVEHLVEAETSAQPKKADTLVLMISTLLRSKLSLIGLSTSDTISNLLGLAVRRTHAAPDDELLPALIDCVGALGAHTYYADQANDCADEICARISALLLPDTDVAEAAKTSFGNASRRPIKTGDRARDESLRVLLCCLASLIDSANVPSRKSGAGASARPRMSPDTMAPTCALLASPNPRVRLTYHQTVLFFLQREAGPASDTLPSAGVAQQKEATAFLHAWAAGAFVLALARGLSMPQGASETPLSALPILDRSNAEGVRGPAPETAAQPVDYAGLTAAADAMARYLPVPATLGLVPGLLALDRAAGSRLSPQGVEGQRLSAARAFVAATLATMAEVWESSSLARSAKAVSDICAFRQVRLYLTSRLSRLRPTTSSPRSLLPCRSSTQRTTLCPSRAAVPEPRPSAAWTRALLRRPWRRAASCSAKPASARKSCRTGCCAIGACRLPSTTVSCAGHGASSCADAGPSALIGASPFRSSLDGAAARPFAGERADGGSDSEADIGAPRGVGVDDFREALGSRSYASKRRTNGELGHGAPNGSSSDPRAERRTSRRVSRKEASVPAAGVPALLDDLHVGVAEESGADGEQRPTLVAPALS